MNLLRLPVNWSGIEPEPDAFNEAYLNQMMGLIEECHAVGVYTVVDLHQDAYSKEIGEDGAPLWAIVPAPPTPSGPPARPSRTPTPTWPRTSPPASAVTPAWWGSS